MEKTKTQLIVEKAMATIRPAIEQVKKDIAASFSVPTTPYEVFKKPYEQLDDWQIFGLIDAFHQEGETEPCAMCKWMAESEVKKLNQDKAMGFAE